MEEKLINSALNVLGNSYAPYSGFNVAAAVLTDSGKIYTGVNVENASYPAGRCAECNAVSSAVSSGERRIKAIAIVSRDSKDKTRATGSDLKVIMAKSVSDYKTMTLAELLPESFGPENL